MRETKYIGNIEGFREFLRINGGWVVNPIEIREYYQNKYGWTWRYVAAGNTRGEQRFASEQEAIEHATNWVNANPEKRTAYW